MITGTGRCNLFIYYIGLAVFATVTWYWLIAVVLTYTILIDNLRIFKTPDMLTLRFILLFNKKIFLTILMPKMCQLEFYQRHVCQKYHIFSEISINLYLPGIPCNWQNPILKGQCYTLYNQNLPLRFQGDISPQ